MVKKCKEKKCKEKNCNDQPSYNLKGETKPLYCSKHKKQGMVNVKDKKCVSFDFFFLFSDFFLASCSGDTYEL